MVLNDLFQLCSVGSLECETPMAWSWYPRVAQPIQIKLYYTATLYLLMELLITSVKAACFPLNAVLEISATMVLFQHCPQLATQVTFLYQAFLLSQ